MLNPKLSSTEVLCLYNQSNQTKVSADALLYGIAAVLLQRQECRVGASSMYFTTTDKPEQKYGQTEKEVLSITWTLQTIC